LAFGRLQDKLLQIKGVGDGNLSNYFGKQAGFLGNHTAVAGLEAFYNVCGVLFGCFDCEFVEGLDEGWAGYELARVE
jgi:hypothetical protein